MKSFLRIFTTFSFIILAFVCTLTFNLSAKDDLVGDANSDNEVDLKDATLLLKHCAEWDGLSIDGYVADVNGDRILDLKDATLLLKHSAEWDVTFAEPSNVNKSDVIFNLLGIKQYDNIGDVYPSENGRKLYVIYSQIINRSDEDFYINPRNYMVEAVGSNFIYKADMLFSSIPENGFNHIGGWLEPGADCLAYWAFEGPSNFNMLYLHYYPLYYGYEPTWATADDYIYKQKVKFAEEVRETIMMPYAGYIHSSDADTSDGFKALKSLWQNSAWGNATQNIEYVKEELDKLEVCDLGYYWTDIGTDGYPTAILSRLTSLIRLLGREGLASLDNEYKEKLLGALDVWLNGNYEHSNWYHNEISTPDTLSTLCILLEGYLEGERLEKMQSLVEKGILFHRIVLDDSYWVGYNLAYAFVTTSKYAVFMNDESLLRSSLEYFVHDTKIQPFGRGGIQSDNIFFQHNQALCVSYGNGYCSNTATFLNMLNQAGIQIPDETIQLLTDFVIEGQDWISRGKYGSFLFSGRSCYSYMTNATSKLAASLCAFDSCTRKDELQEIIEIHEQSNYSKIEYGIKYFDTACLSVMRSPYATMYARGAHTKAANTEYMHGENRLCRNLSYGGITENLAAGGEYQDIKRYWDWCLLPGSTAFMETDDELAAWAEQVKTDTQDSNIKTTNDYSGGYSDGTVSVMYTKLVNEEGLTALKTYIQLNSITICLGTDITCTKENNEKFINTSIEQCYLNNASYNGQSIDGTVITVTDNKAIYNGAFAYYNLDTDKVLHVDCREVEGSASRVVAGASTAVTTADIFKVWLEHGYDPDGDKYAYAIRATGDGNAPADASGLGIVKIENTSDMQIIEFDDGTIAGVFHNTSAIYETATGSELSPEDGETVVIKNPIL